MLYPENAVLLAPLAGHTDLPMRLSARRHSCRFAFTEMIDAGSLVFGNLKTMTLARRGETEDFLGIQLVGSELDTLTRAVEIVNTMRFDVLDFNLGCPAPKVERKCEGAAFALKNPDGAVRALEQIVRTSKIPVTVKTRILSREDPAPTVAFVKRLENAGAASVTLHGRLLKEFYSGTPAFDVISAVRENIGIPLIANGGIMSRQTCAEMREKSGCSRVMIARGALGNPWIFEEISDPERKPPSVAEFAEEIERHVADMTSFYGEEMGFRIGRKMLLEYLRGRGYAGALRASASYLSDYDGFRVMLNEIQRGPAPGYWTFLAQNPESPRRLREF